MLFRRDPPRRSSPPGLWADMSRQRRLATAWGGPQWLSRAVESCPELSRGDARERPLMQEVLESCGRLAGTVSGCALHVLCGMQELTLGISNSQDPCHGSFLICSCRFFSVETKQKKARISTPACLASGTLQWAGEGGQPCCTNTERAPDLGPEPAGEESM